MLSCFKADPGEEEITRQYNFPQMDLVPHELDKAQMNLQAGVPISKYCSNKRKKEKMLYLDQSKSKLTYTPSKKPVRNTTIYIKDVMELRDVEVKAVVPKTKVFQSVASTIHSDDKQLCLGLIFKCGDGKTKTLNMGFKTAEAKSDVRMAISFLATVVNKSRRSTNANAETQRILELWMEADHDKDKKLSRTEVEKLLQKLNVQLNKSALKEMFEHADKDASDYLSFDEFREFYKALHKRPEIEPLFKTFSSNSKITIDGFIKFCRDKQQEIIKVKDAVDEFSHFGNKLESLTEAQFIQFIFGRQNSWWKPEDRLRVKHDMNQPLKNYFISSSHNTYLTGDQLVSASDADMYKVVLERGCRCVELDCWDGADGAPEIYHGYTRTSKIKFRAVVETIEKHAFTTSPYPVILSLEVHTSEQQQATMASDMKEVFGEKLLKRDFPVENMTPEALKYKILIKCKMAPQHWAKRDDEDSEDEKEECTGIIEKKSSQQISRSKQISVELSDIVTLRATKVNDWGQHSKPNEMQSYSESKCLDLLSTDPARFAEMNKKMLSRIYPKGSRIGSDNYDPFGPWSAGCQCVALNWQVADSHMRLMETKFESNGGCGYLLKPKHLIDGGSELYNDYKQSRLVVNIISGSQIPKPGNRGEVVDPYITAQITGSKEDTCEPQKTHVVKRNGFNPVWQTPFSFTIRHTSIAMLTLTVKDSDKLHKNMKIAEASIPILSLRRGYRCVPLRSISGRCELEHSSLLCSFDLQPSR